MKKIIAAVVVALLLIGGGVFYYQNQQTVPNYLVNSRLETAQNPNDNKLGGYYRLLFTKNKATLVVFSNAVKTKSSNKVDQKLFQAVAGNKSIATVGRNADLGRVHVTKDNNKLVVKSKKLTLTFTINDNAYYTDDGTMWLVAK
ncbi:hypothetical protein [Lactobacillus gigeriorum]|uniref:Uncharacterized protein n=1 Tax=Lactobacillus gigeriorum DSM 23908 = CRBIP 24.85 TaxID=1423751 RepID=I7K1N2_9LACO|nr:hypothetical protein [Lactobacillus gigeriorum]KRN11188.1 hypothetical protein FC38_GL000869 [Lactobacillus gigeriorum DSM 23908 = CRBIP 24.85]CCI87545.1 Putative uncharacterized protein [Lactobacillus gigeriorum DSM 23908 = CRBIP 24.85]